MAKSHVSIGMAQCPVCGAIEESGEILLDKRLEDSLERETVTHLAMCKEHQAQKDDGYIHIVICEEPENSGNTLKFNDAVRTGEIISVKKDAFREIFNTELPESGMVFAGRGVGEVLREIYQSSQTGEGDDNADAGQDTIH